MAKKATLTTVTSTNNNSSVLNSNFNAINNKLDNTLSLDGSTPNAMAADLDLDSNDILNVRILNSESFYLNGTLVTNLAAFPTWANAWVTATSYSAYELVNVGKNFYVCLAAHTSGTFSTDLAAGLWQLYFVSNYDPDDVDIGGGEIDGTDIGANEAATGAFTTLDASGATDLADTLNVDGATTLNGGLNVDSGNGTEVTITENGSTVTINVDPDNDEADSDLVVAIDNTAAMVVDGTGLRVGDATSPTVGLEVGTTDAALLPAGTTAQRPSTGVNGYIRYNSDDGQFEGYADGAWGAIAGSGGGGTTAAEFRGFRARLTGTAQTVSTSSTDDVIFNTEDFDTENAYNTSTGEFTVPSALNGKKMLFVAQVRTSTGIAATVRILQDSTVIGQDETGQDDNAPVDLNRKFCLNPNTGPIEVSTGEVYKVTYANLDSGSASIEEDARVWFAGYVVEAGTLQPTRTVESISATEVTDVSIPDGCTWFRFHFDGTADTSTTPFNGELLTGGTTTDALDGLRQLAGATSHLSGATAFFTSGGAGNTTARHCSGTIWSPRDSSKNTLVDAFMAAGTNTTSSQRSQYPADDNDTFRIKATGGTITGDLEIEWFYS